MNDDEIERAAVAELRKLWDRQPEIRDPKVLLTARVIAKRIRANTGLKTLDQGTLYVVLEKHLQRGVGKREIRNSPSPSRKTLETLWVAVGPGFGEDLDVKPPTLLQDANGPAEEGAEDDTDFPSTFLAYCHRDEETIKKLVAELEARDQSIWFAGRRIVAGQNISDEVRRAMHAVRSQILYLSRDSFQSLWVGKEILFGLTRNLEQTVVLNGGDTELVQLLLDWTNEKFDSEHSHIAEYFGPTEEVATDFQSTLKDYLRAGQPIYLYPEPAADLQIPAGQFKTIGEFAAAQ